MCVCGVCGVYVCMNVCVSVSMRGVYVCECVCEYECV